MDARGENSSVLPLVAVEDKAEEFARVRADLPYLFWWNQRECRGSELHEAVRQNDCDSVRTLLRADPSQIGVRFRYITRGLEGDLQEGSGQAIHIAASRASFAMTDLLLEFSASLDACVTRGGQNHYNVLHAGVFNEGGGGNELYVRRLLDLRAELRQNLAGYYPLHIAFQVGNIGVIEVLRQERKERGAMDCEDGECYEGQTPLEVAITNSSMTDTQLVAAAPLTPFALHVFSKHEPRCIPMWLQRLTEEDVPKGQTKAEFLATQVTRDEIAQVLREDADAADALFNSILSAPRVVNKGLNHLPPKLNFGPQRWVDYIFSIFNPPQCFLVTYELEKEWGYNGAEFSRPAWQSVFTERTGKQLLRDTEILVCHVPNIIDADIFSGIVHCAATYEDHKLFENPLVEGLVMHVWWQAAYMVELGVIVLNVCGLVLLIADLVLERRMQLHHDGGGADADGAARELKAVHGSSHSRGVSHFGDEEDLQHAWFGDLRLSRDFIIAKGLVDCTHELLGMVGLVLRPAARSASRLAKPWAALRRVRGQPLLLAAAPLVLCLERGELDELEMAARVLIIVIYWGSLLNVQYLSENVATATLPLTGLVKGLLPSLALTMAWFASYTHIRMYLHPTTDWQQIMLGSFITLFTGGLPTTLEEGGEGGPAFQHLDTMIVCMYVALFTLFFWNIFIGVITELYSKAEKSVHTRYQQMLATACKLYLARVRVLRPVALPKRVCYAIALLAFAVGCTLQIYSMVQGHPLPYLCPCLVACMMLLHYASHACANSCCSKDNKQRYLWIARERHQKGPDPLDEEDLVVLSDTMSMLRALSRKSQGGKS